MKEILILLSDYRITFIVIFFSGVLFGVVAQKIAEGKPVKPLIRRIAIAGLTTSFALTVNDFTFKFHEATLYMVSPIIGFFGEAIIETLNARRTGIGTGIAEILLEKMGFIKKGGGKDEQ